MEIDEVTATDMSLGEARALTPVERSAVYHTTPSVLYAVTFLPCLTHLLHTLAHKITKLYQIFTGFSLFSLFWYGSTAIYFELINKWFSKSPITLHSQQQFYVIEFF